MSGPVRAIRSHIGANSFVYTVQTELFYPRRQDTVIELQGHGGLPGYASYDDLTTGLAGMTYSDNANTNLAIDGTADAVHADQLGRRVGDPADRVAARQGPGRIDRHHPDPRHGRDGRPGQHLVPGRQPGQPDPVHGRRRLLGSERLPDPRSAGHDLPEHGPDARR